MTRPHEQKTVHVPPEAKGERLDRYLAGPAELELSRSLIQRIIVEGLVTVNGSAVAKNYRLRGGETIALTIPAPQTMDLTPEDIPLNIVYEDDYLAVIDKPAGLVVHPAPGNPRHTLVNALLYHLKKIAPDDTGLRPGIIHRLDKETSGLLLIAKDDLVGRKLREQLAARTIIKKYQAIICGHMPQEQGTIELPIGRSIKNRKVMTVTNLHARDATTRYTVMISYRLVDVVEIELVTGRTHQIRVHFSHLNHPILGDPEYGGRQKWLRGIDPARRREAVQLLELAGRQALHAKTLTFVHPVTGKEMTITSELPPDLARLMEHLELEKG